MVRVPSEITEAFGERISSIGVSGLRQATEQELDADLHPRATGQERFDQMTKAEQDEALGPDIAEAVRKGDVKLSDLVSRDGDLITQASPKELGIDTEEPGSA